MYIKNKLPIPTEMRELFSGVPKGNLKGSAKFKINGKTMDFTIFHCRIIDRFYNFENGINRLKM